MFSLLAIVALLVLVAFFAVMVVRRKQDCATCRYFRADEPVLSGSYYEERKGTCRRKTPEVITMHAQAVRIAAPARAGGPSLQVHSYWPPVTAGEVCGEHRAVSWVRRLVG